MLATPHALHGPQIEAPSPPGKHVLRKTAAMDKAREKAVRLCSDALVLGTGHDSGSRRIPNLFFFQGRRSRTETDSSDEANFSHDKFLGLDRNNWYLEADQAPAAGMTATGIHLLELSVRLLGPAESVCMRPNGYVLVRPAPRRYCRRLHQV